MTALQTISIIVSILAVLISGAGSIMALIVLRNGSGIAAKRADERMELALSRFQTAFETRLDKRFADLVSKESLEMRLKLIEQKQAMIEYKLTNTRLTLSEAMLSRDT